MPRFGGIFDFEEKRERLQEVELELADGEVWNAVSYTHLTLPTILLV